MESYLDQSLIAAGLDSLKASEISIRIRFAFHKEISVESIVDCRRVSDLLDLLSASSSYQSLPQPLSQFLLELEHVFYSHQYVDTTEEYKNKFLALHDRLENVLVDTGVTDVNLLPVESASRLLRFVFLRVGKGAIFPEISLTRHPRIASIGALETHRLELRKFLWAIKEDLVAGTSLRKPLLISFGGGQHGLQMPLADFYATSKGLGGFDKLFIRDLYVRFYQLGLLYQTESVAQTANLIREYIRRLNPSYTIFTGTCMGGYAAVMFGVMLACEVSEVHAFSPVADLSASSHALQLVSGVPGSDSRYFALADRVAEVAHLPLRFHVYFGALNSLDSASAKKLSAAANVILHSYDSEEHNIAAWLKKSGELASIMAKWIR